MKLVVGLGNPERKYEGTRHNIGFVVLATLAHRCGASRPKAGFQGEVVEAAIRGEKVLLLCPTTYMNRSGASVQAAVAFYKLPLEEMLVVCDDLNLPLGRIRIRPEGSTGGQKGLADIVRRLGSQEFPRLRVGIGQPPERWDAADYVLSKFTKEEQEEVDLAVQRAADAVTAWVVEGIQASMNQYNGSSS